MPGFLCPTSSSPAGQIYMHVTPGSLLLSRSKSHSGHRVRSGQSYSIQYSICFITSSPPQRVFFRYSRPDRFKPLTSQTLTWSSCNKLLFLFSPLARYVMFGTNKETKQGILAIIIIIIIQAIMHRITIPD